MTPSLRLVMVRVCMVDGCAVEAGTLDGEQDCLCLNHRLEYRAAFFGWKWAQTEPPSPEQWAEEQDVPE